MDADMKRKLNHELTRRDTKWTQKQVTYTHQRREPSLKRHSSEQNLKIWFLSPLSNSYGENLSIQGLMAELEETNHALVVVERSSRSAVLQVKSIRRKAAHEGSGLQA